MLAKLKLIKQNIRKLTEYTLITMKQIKTELNIITEVTWVLHNNNYFQDFPMGDSSIVSRWDGKCTVMEN